MCVLTTGAHSPRRADDVSATYGELVAISAETLLVKEVRAVNGRCFLDIGSGSGKVLHKTASTGRTLRPRCMYMHSLTRLIRTYVIRAFYALLPYLSRPV